LGIEQIPSVPHRNHCALIPPRDINLPWFPKLQDARAYRRIRIVQCSSEKSVLFIVYHRDLAGFAGAVLFEDALGEKPGMAGSDDLFGRSRGP
jgi:hypothetical protein